MINNLYRVFKRFSSPPRPYSLLDELKRKGLKVGANFDMQAGCIIDYSHCFHITIGNNVTFAPRVHI